MRKIGILESSGDAERFHHFLTSEGIENRIDQSAPVWEVWILNDDELEKAQAELDSFINFPNDPRFKVKPQPRVQPSPPSKSVMWSGSRDIPVTRFLLVSCILMTVYTGMGRNKPEVMNWLYFSHFVKPDGTWSFPPEIMHGEIWRIWTPVFVHLSFFHLAFNLYFLWILGNTIERTKGSGKFLLFCLVTGAGAHFTQYFVVGPNFSGISGVVYGLLGYLWMKQMVVPEEGYVLPDTLVIQMLIWLFLGLSGVLDAWGFPVANGAHFGGLLAGMLLGSFPNLRHRTA